MPKVSQKFWFYQAKCLTDQVPFKLSDLPYLGKIYEQPRENRKSILSLNLSCMMYTVECTCKLLMKNLYSSNWHVYSMSFHAMRAYIITSHRRLRHSDFSFAERYLNQYVCGCYSPQVRLAFSKWKMNNTNCSSSAIIELRSSKYQFHIF